MTLSTVGVRPQSPATGPRQRHRTATAWAAAGPATVLVLSVWNPNTSRVPLCPLHAVTGLDCPLCGGLRAAWSLLRGHVGAAANQNLLVVIAAVLAVPGAYLTLRSPECVRAAVSDRRSQLLLVVALVAFTVLRNVPALGWLAAGR